MSENTTVTETRPTNWRSDQEIIAKDALAVLVRHYPGYKWGVEWSECINNQLGILIIRVLDLPTDIVSVVNPKDIDRDRMTCAMRAGGLILEALGLPAMGARHGADKVRGLKYSPAGLIVPDYNAVPENNPGYEKYKKQSNLILPR